MHTTTPNHPPRHGLSALAMRGTDVHVLDRLGALLRYRWAALAVLALVMAGAVVFTYSESPMYRSTARILIELEDERSIALEGVSAASSSEYSLDPEPYFQTQYRILTGLDLARRATARIDRRALP